jgi:phenylacetate-coenzyme A ligase PaaK-like adenylate-forming protein
MEAARDRRVRSTVEHAARHVPYYRDLFHASGVEAGDIRTAADLGRPALPSRARGSLGHQMISYAWRATQTAAWMKSAVKASAATVGTANLRRSLCRTESKSRPIPMPLGAAAAIERR